MISDNQSICPKCGGQLKYYDHVQRLVRTKFGNKKWVAIRRLRCCKCNAVHRELPDFIFPYKQYEADIITTGLIGVASLTTMMVAAAKAMSSNSKTIIKGATQMVIFAAAIKILASVCEQLAKLDWNQLAKGLVGVGVLLAEVSLFLRTAKFSGKSITTATGIVILSAAIKVLASACKDFGEMKWEDIGKGLASIAVLLAEVTAFTKLTGNAKHVISTGVALIAIGAAMKIFASAVKDFSGMQWDEIARGLVAMAGALVAVTIAVNFMPKNMIGIGTGLIAVSAALLILANALNQMGSMSWEEIAKGLITLGGAMAILAIGLNAMTGTLAGSAALLVAASALLVLTPVLAILGAMSWSSIVKGLVIVINTSKGDKSITLIREGVSYNILNCLDKNTDWFTLAKGDNIFAFTADSGVTNLQFRIENKVIYEGV